MDQHYGQLEGDDFSNDQLHEDDIYEFDDIAWDVAARAFGSPEQADFEDHPESAWRKYLEAAFQVWSEDGNEGSFEQGFEEFAEICRGTQAPSCPQKDDWEDLDDLLHDDEDNEVHQWLDSHSLSHDINVLGPESFSERYRLA